MQPETDDNSLILVRAAPGTLAAERALRQVAALLAEPGGAVTVFFHGPGVAHARGGARASWLELASDPRMVLEVCTSAWARHGDGALPLPFRGSTLIRFWDRAASGWQLYSFGAGHD